MKYDALLAAGKDKDASDLLSGTKASAEHVLAMMKQAKDNSATRTVGASNTAGDELALEQARAELKKAGVGNTEKEIKSQQTLVEALRAQVSIEERVAALKKQDSGNATLSTGKEMAALRAEGARSAAEHAQKMGEIALSAERESSNASLAVRSASIAERLAADERLANEEYAIQAAGNQQLITALDKGGKDYNNQLHSLQQKAEELTASHNATLSNLESKAKEAQYREDLQNLTQAKREQIEATMQGSRERISAIDAAIKEEQSKNLQDTAFYRDLLKQRVETLRDSAAEEAKLRAEAGQQAAENEQKMGELLNAAERQRLALRDSALRASVQRERDEALAAANDEFALKQRAMQQEAAALDKGAKDYENKLKAIQNKKLQLVREHENAITAIKDKAVTEQNQKQLAALTQLESMTAEGLSQVIMGHKSFASMMSSIGDQVVSGMLRTALMSMMTADLDKERQAASAARTMFLSGAKLPFPANIIAAPVMGAAAFASMMAFQEGGMVPGVGRGDIVPAMLEPGEGIIKNTAMDKLNRGELGGAGVTNHIHFRPTYHLQALDATGMEKVLDKHAPTLQKHVENVFRKLNK